MTPPELGTVLDGKAPVNMRRFRTVIVATIGELTRETAGERDAVDDVKDSRFGAADLIDAIRTEGKPYEPGASEDMIWVRVCASPPGSDCNSLSDSTATLSPSAPSQQYDPGSHPQ